MVTSATKNHEHQWVFLGELLMTYSQRELNHIDPDLRKLEYCIVCSTARLNMGGDRWAIVQGDCTKDFLRPFQSETHAEVVHPSEEMTFKQVSKFKRSKNRLGRGLNDLMEMNSRSKSSLPALFKKSEKKD